ncbi:MAG: HD domain-containing protein [Candidatus Eremiobacterota bacterium]
MREKILRDPVHGSLPIPFPVLLDLIDTPEFQRLRNIRQLGMCSTTFHGAEHSRFQHVLGVMWLMHRVLERWHLRGMASLSEEERHSACAAAMLHDVGHGPFSHALERVFSGVDHETLGHRIIRERLSPVLERHGLKAETVVAMLEGTHPRPVFHELLASQLDVDRMDYLLRDSLYTGVKYGLFDLERILHTLVPLQDPRSGLVAALDLKGVDAVEEFLFSRYFMQWQVYRHRTVRSAEVLLRTVLERARHTFEVDPGSLHIPPNLRFLFQGGQPDSPAFLDAFLDLDDFDLFHAIKTWRGSSDPVLADLSVRFVCRRPYKVLLHPGPGPAFEAVRALVQDRFGPAWPYYLREDAPEDSGWLGETRLPIRVHLGDGRWEEFSHRTRTDAVLALAKTVRSDYLMLPPECRGRAVELLNDPGLVSSPG